MRTFFSKLLAFLFLYFIVDYGIGFLLSTVYADIEKGDIGRNNYITNNLTDKDILIFGSSRAIHHYDPDIIGDSLSMTCYNCGDDGMGIILNYARLQAILSRYTPKLIIYDIEPGFDIERNDNLRYLGKLKPYYPKYNLQPIFNSVSDREQYKMLSQLYRYNSQLFDILIQRLSSSTLTARDYKYAPLDKTMDYEPEPIPFSPYEVDSLKVKYLKSFIKECNKKGVTLFLTISPKYKNTTELDLNPIIGENNLNVRVISHYADSAFNFRKQLFVDQNHLNKNGAIIYSNCIASEIIKDLSMNYRTAERR